MEKTSGNNEYISPESRCSYLPDKLSQMHYRLAEKLSPEEYLEYINKGWRRFGYTLFRPACASCKACQPIRILSEQFQPNRSQKRVIKSNSGLIELRRGTPSLDLDRLNLYLNHHDYRKETRGWTEQDSLSAIESITSFVEGPLAVQEWAYYLDDKLVAICYVDSLPDGLSGIYFYHSPEHRHLSLGNWICLSLIEQAKKLDLPYVYLGYYVQGCLSMEYKSAFKPSQILNPDGSWLDFKH